MRDILDPADRWLGTPPLALIPGNKRPVTVPDALSVVRDSGPVSLNVLANDFDPEGQPLTLIDAQASLGNVTHESTGLVTYTPPPGVSGADTILYTVTDDLNQARTGQVNVTITVPELSIDLQPDNTLVVTAETGMIDITVTDPAEFAGTWQVDMADLAGGPVNLVAPSISGTVSTGNVLSAEDGLWIFDAAGAAPSQSWQWQRAGADLGGETGATYTVTPADLGQGMRVVETLSDANGQRLAASPVIGAAFQPSDDTGLRGWWDAADTATISYTGGTVTSWADKSGGDALIQPDPSRQPVTAARVLNGQNVLDFDGTDYLLRSETLPASGDVAFHAVLVLDQVTSAFAACLAYEANADFQIDANNASAFDGRLNLAGVGSPTGFSGGPFAGALVLSVVFDRTGAGQAEVFIGGTSRAITAYTAPLDASGALHLMANRTPNAFINGAVAELIVTGDVTNRADYHTYLTTKWGVS